MKNKIYKLKGYLAFAALFGVAVACQDLDEHPQGFVSPDNFYSTIGQGESALIGSMDALWSYWGSNYSYGYGNFIHDDQLLDGDLNIGNNFGGDLWTAHYLALNQINGVLRAVKANTIKGASQADIDGLVAQSKFLRAYNYFALVRLFGDVPLITEDTPDPVNNPVKTRATIANVYSLIEADLLFAVEHLGEETPSRPSKGAAQALLAKAYLTMATAPLNQVSNYAKARDMAKALIDEGTYSLVGDVYKVFAAESKNGPENIWNFNSTLNDPATDPQIWTPEIMDGWGDASLDITWAENWFAKRPDEPRQDAYLILEYDGTPYTDFAEKRPFVKKYVMPMISQDEYDNIQSTAIIPILRYADVLLIYAEAANMAEGGPSAAAYDALNMVRRRAAKVPLDVANPAVDLAGATQASFDAAVIEERDFELVFEFDRWFDIIRKRLLPELTTKYHPEDIGNFSNDDYLYPIPDFDAEAIGSQNPGYTFEN